MNEAVPFKKRVAFKIAPVEVTLTLDLDMAVALGDFILDKHPDNPAIAALGYQLQNIMPPDDAEDTQRFNSRVNGH